MKAKRGEKSGAAEKRYSAKLLFQYRVMIGNSPGKLRTCEVRIITFASTSAHTALREARRRSRAAQHRYTNSGGNPVYFEFIGIMELLCLDTACETDEVWYQMHDLIRPMERKSRFVPPESELHAIRNNE